MSRPQPLRFACTSADDPELLGLTAEVRSHGGWINVSPVIDPEDEPPPPGPFAFLGGSTHKVPTVTWIAERSRSGATSESVGLQHASGPRVVARLAQVGLALPDGWRVTQDHPRRGLVATLSQGTARRDGDADRDVDRDADRAMWSWLLAAATATCAVPTLGRWSGARFLALS